MKKILDWLFGKDPEIFDEEGRVRHNLPDEKWKNWQDRYQNDPEYNWRHHTGTRSKTDKPNTQR